MPATIDLSLPAAQAAQAVAISEDWAAADRRPADRRPPSPPARPAIASKRPALVELTDKRIKQAVSETIAAAPDKASTPANQPEALRGAVFSADKVQTFTNQFAYAKVPYCLGQDSLKFQPPKLGPVIFGGILAIPFLLVAKVRGKCI
jgi:hypothetical protein